MSKGELLLIGVAFGMPLGVVLTLGVQALASLVDRRV